MRDVGHGRSVARYVSSMYDERELHGPHTSVGLDLDDLWEIDCRSRSCCADGNNVSTPVPNIEWLLHFPERRLRAVPQKGLRDYSIEKMETAPAAVIRRDDALIKNTPSLSAKSSNEMTSFSCFFLARP